MEALSWVCRSEGTSFSTAHFHEPKTEPFQALVLPEPRASSHEIGDHLDEVCVVGMRGILISNKWDLFYRLF